MKVLMVHSYYRSSLPSGENDVYEAEKKLMEDGGEHVLSYTKRSDDALGVCLGNDADLPAVLGGG